MAQAHNYYLGEYKNDGKPMYFLKHTQFSIVPFFVMGTYGGIYGAIFK